MLSQRTWAFAWWCWRCRLRVYDGNLYWQRWCSPQEKREAQHCHGNKKNDHFRNRRENVEPRHRLVVVLRVLYAQVPDGLRAIHFLFFFFARAASCSASRSRLFTRNCTRAVDIGGVCIAPISARVNSSRRSLNLRARSWRFAFSFSRGWVLMGRIYKPLLKINQPHKSPVDFFGERDKTRHHSKRTVRIYGWCCC